jgi:L-threonate 2-dehydrogenase
MSYIVAVIAPGAMGSAIGRRLRENGAQVRTSLTGRSAAAIARAQAAGMDDVEDALIVSSDIILSVVPPAEALAVARRFAPQLERAGRKPIFVDCNAVNPHSVAAVGAVITATGTPFVDACIIGPPPQAGVQGPALYMSGPHAQATLALAQFGLDVRILQAPIGAASALKMSYAGITKGLTGLAAAMILSASRAGAGAALLDELEKSQPMLLKRFTKSVPDMYPKAYRWVAEMQEIAQFAGNDSATQAIYNGLASLFERLAQDYGNDRTEIDAIKSFLGGLNVEGRRNGAS